MAKPVSPRAFDSGLAVANRTVVRNGVVALLAPMLKANGGFLPRIVKLDTPLEAYPEDGLQQLFETLLGAAPAIAVACGDRDSKPAGVGGFNHMSHLDVHLYFLNNSQRSLMARVETDVVGTADLTADPGIDVAMQCAEELLIGQVPENVSEGVIKHLELKRERPLSASNRLTLWTQQYLVGVTRSINRNRNVVQRLVGFNTVVRIGDEPADSPASVPFTTEVAPP